MTDNVFSGTLNPTQSLVACTLFFHGKGCIFLLFLSAGLPAAFVICTYASFGYIYQTFFDVFLCSSKCVHSRSVCMLVRVDNVNFCQ